MKKFFIIIPIFNDWRSLNKLLKKINKNINNIQGSFTIIIVNDCSTLKTKLALSSLNNISKIKIINLKQNIGSQRAIHIALEYLKSKNRKSFISIMDSDGEDDPARLKDLIELSVKNKKYIILANRSKRKENFFLLILNKIRLILTWIITGKYINFGNYSSFSSYNLKNILKTRYTWLAYSGAISKNCKNSIKIDVEKKNRYFGLSKVNFHFLLSHAIKIICIFKTEVLIRTSILFFLIILFFINEILIIYSSLVLLLSLNFFIIIFYKKNKLTFNSKKLIGNIKTLKN